MRTLCKLLVLCAVFSLFLPSARGQIVNNPYFHILRPPSPLNTCSTANVTIATSVNQLQVMCDSWFTPTNGTPDFFFGCDNLPSGSPDYGVPRNVHYPAIDCHDADDPTGLNLVNYRAYTGIEIKDNPSAALRDREYISQPLNSPLQPGRYYTVSFMVRSSSINSYYLASRLGCLLTTNAPNVTNTYDNNNGAINTAIGDYAEVNQPGGWDANNWYYVSMQVFITGTTKNYLTIGNFQEDIPDAEWTAQATMQPEPVPVPEDGGIGYYLIDNVQICDMCPLGIDLKKKISSDPEKCCYDLTFLGDPYIYCGVESSISIQTPGGTTIINGPFYFDTPVEVCVNRFTSGTAIIKLLGGEGQILCQYAKNLKCDCECTLEGQPGFSITLEPTAGFTSSQCCWNVVVNNNDVQYPDENGCDVRARGIVFTPQPGGTFTPAGGYSLQTLIDNPGSTPDVKYLTKNNTNGGDLYQTSTSTVIGTLCLSQGTLDYTTSFSVMTSLTPPDTTFCGKTMTSTVSCADRCCYTIQKADLRSVSSADPEKCCFVVDIAINSVKKCSVTTVAVQTCTSSGWITENIVPVPGSMFSIPLDCIPVGTSKQIRLVFKDSFGTAVCVRELLLKCEDDCCSRVQDLQAYRTSVDPCCYLVHGNINGPGSGCALITHFTADKFVAGIAGSPGSWVSIPSASGIPTPGGNFNIPVCITLPASGLVRIQFRDAGDNVVCTRWLNFDCPGVTHKLGANTATGMLAPKVSAVPNPAVGETSIRYTLLADSDVRVTLFNSIGDMVVEVQAVPKAVGEQTTTISTAELPSGVYFVQVSAGGDIITVPLTVVK